MRNIIYIIMALGIAAFYSCGRQQAAFSLQQSLIL